MNTLLNSNNVKTPTRHGMLLTNAIFSVKMVIHSHKVSSSGHGRCRTTSINRIKPLTNKWNRKGNKESISLKICIAPIPTCGFITYLLLAPNFYLGETSLSLIKFHWKIKWKKSVSLNSVKVMLERSTLVRTSTHASGQLTGNIWDNRPMKSFKTALLCIRDYHLD